MVHRIPPRPLNGSPHRRLPCRAAKDAVREASHVERRAPVTVPVLPQVEIVADPMLPDRQQTDAVPVVEPPMDETQLRLVRVHEYRRECGPEATAGSI